MNTSYSDKRRVKLTNAFKSALLFVLVLTSQYAKATTTTAGMSTAGQVFVPRDFARSSF